MDIDRKIKAVIKKMGSKYICHKDNHVQRLPEPLTDSAGTNITRTFDRARAEKDQATTGIPKVSKLARR